MYTERKISTSKLRNIRTEYNGRHFDSKFEARVAATLDIMKRAGEIKDWEPQFKLEMWAYDCHGKKALKKTHKVDFRVHENDGTFRLLEAKGFETDDYRDRRRWLEAFWLPENPDHVYEVVKEKSRRWLSL
jgi:hypothetical protein